MIGIRTRITSDHIEQVMERNLPRVMRKVGILGAMEAKRLVSVQAMAKKTKRGSKVVGSKPGEPPRKRSGKLMASIRYSYDESRKSVVVGSRPRAYGWYAKILEHGGKWRAKGWKWKINNRKLKRGDKIPVAVMGGNVLWGEHDGSGDQKRRVRYLLLKISDPLSGKIRPGINAKKKDIFERYEKDVEVEARPFVSRAMGNIRSKIVELFRDKLLK